jgi:hypothetical protein
MMNVPFPPAASVAPGRLHEVAYQFVATAQSSQGWSFESISYE